MFLTPCCRCRNEYSALLSQEPVLPVFDYHHFTGFSGDLKTWFSCRLLCHLMDSVIGTDHPVHQTVKGCRGALPQWQRSEGEVTLHLVLTLHLRVLLRAPQQHALCITLPAWWTKSTGIRKPLQHPGKLDVSYLAYPSPLGISTPAFKTATAKAPLWSN